MPNWCSNSIAFYHEGGGRTILEAFYMDMQKYLEYTEPKTRKKSDWVGHWLQSNRVNTDNLYTRGFFTSCELNADHVRVDMETAWAPLPEVWDLMAEKYGLAYVHISEEPGCEVYVNTDRAGRFFTTQYLLNYFDVDNLGLDADTMEKYGERLREFSGETHYFDSWEDVAEAFEVFGFGATNLDGLNECLGVLGLRVYEYSDE